MLPTERTLRACRDRGWVAGVVERYNHHTRTRHDWGGFGDILVVQPDQHGALLIQACSGGNGDAAARVEKIRTECRAAAAAWLEAGNRIEVWAWRKVGGAGRRKLWQPRIVRVVLRLSLNETLNELPF